MGHASVWIILSICALKTRMDGFLGFEIYFSVVCSETVELLYICVLCEPQYCLGIEKKMVSHNS